MLHESAAGLLCRWLGADELVRPCGEHGAHPGRSRALRTVAVSLICAVHDLCEARRGGLRSEAGTAAGLGELEERAVAELARGLPIAAPAGIPASPAWFVPQHATAPVRRRTHAVPFLVPLPLLPGRHRGTLPRERGRGRAQGAGVEGAPDVCECDR